MPFLAYTFESAFVLTKEDFDVQISDTTTLLHVLRQSVESQMDGDSKAAKNIVAPLRPFCMALCSPSDYPRTATSRMNKRTLMQYLNDAMENESSRVDKISYVSAQPMGAQPSWMSDAAYASIPFFAIEYSLEAHNGRYYQAEYEEVYDYIRPALDGLLDLVHKRVPNVADDDGGRAWEFIEETVMTYLWWAVQGMGTKARRAIPLLKILPWYLPLGVVRSQPGHWLVLTA